MNRLLKNKCRSLFCGIVIVCIFAGFLCGCEDEKQKELTPTDKFFVNDFAGVLDSEDADKIYNAGVNLQEKTGAQAVVVTTESTDNQDISEYAVELGRKWGIGEKDKNNGVLILLATEDRNIYIAVGYGLEGALPDSKTGRLLDYYAVPHLQSNDFSKGISEIYKAVVNEIYIEYGVEPEENYIPANELNENSTADSIDAKAVLISWAIMLLVVIALGIIARKRGVHLFVFPFFFGGGRGGFGGFGGGSFGGGSSGFGGFGGGGGSFGGGGAGRGF